MPLLAVSSRSSIQPAITEGEMAPPKGWKLGAVGPQLVQQLPPHVGLNTQLPKALQALTARQQPAAPATAGPQPAAGQLVKGAEQAGVAFGSRSERQPHEFWAPWSAMKPSTD